MRNSSLRVSVLIGWLLFLAPGFSRAHGESPRSAHRTSQAGQVVSISDIHFNPFYDPALIPSLIRADYHKWPAIFSRSLIPGYSRQPLMLDAQRAPPRGPKVLNPDEPAAAGTAEARGWLVA